MKTTKNPMPSKTAKKQLTPQPQTPIEKFLALTEDQKDAEVAEFKNGADLSQFQPLTQTERKLWQKAKRKIGRPQIGKGAKIVPVSVERGLLKQADSFAKRHNLKRSQMVADGLRLLMQNELHHHPDRQQ